MVNNKLSVIYNFGQFVFFSFKLSAFKKYSESFIKYVYYLTKYITRTLQNF